MKLGWDNYLKTSTITASSENSAYPVDNLPHQFLEKKYQAEDDIKLDTITIDFLQDRTISMLAYGYNNISGNRYGGTIQLSQDATDGYQLSQSATDGIQTEQADYIDFFNSSGTFLNREAVTNGDDFNFSYFDAITCRSIVIHLSSDSTLYIGGMCATNPLEFEHLQVNPQLPISDRGKPKKTDDGQLLPDVMPLLRKWTVVIPYGVVTNDVRREILAMYKEMGSSTPMWADLWDGDTANLDITEEPMYCNLVINSTRKGSTSRGFNIGMTFEECR